MTAVAPSPGKGRLEVETEAGLTENVTELIETPAQMLKRVLLTDESIQAEFDCYFPTFFMPKWQIMLLIISTCGFYLIVIAFRSIQNWCYKKKFCTPQVVEFQRGKVTKHYNTCVYVYHITICNYISIGCNDMCIYICITNIDGYNQ